MLCNKELNINCHSEKSDKGYKGLKWGMVSRWTRLALIAVHLTRTGRTLSLTIAPSKRGPK